MKTERFDEEFRRKLLGLPAEADPGEVERIRGFVKANKPALPGLGWGKLFLYGGSSLLLIGSLSYNLLQNYRNTHLQSSIDSLAHRSVGQAPSSEVIRHDTVYITRSGKTEPIRSVPEPTIVSETAGKESLKQAANTTQSDITGGMDSIAMERPKLSRSGHETNPTQPEIDSPQTILKSNTPKKHNVATTPNQRTDQSNQLPVEATGDVAPSPANSSGRSITEKVTLINGKERIMKPISGGLETVEEASPDVSLSAVARSNRRRSRVRQTVSAIDKRGQLAINQSRKQNQPGVSSPSMAGFTTANTENATSATSIPELNRPAIPVEPLASRQRISSNQMAIISPSYPLVIPKNDVLARATRRSWHLTMPNLSIPNAQYRIGGGLSAGVCDQFGVALLGEVMLKPRWSVQAGLRIGYGEGFHYRDEQDFNEHQREDFRQTYASQVSSSSDIENIKQVSLSVRVPFQVAYHLPLGRQWGLRLGAGTDLDVWVRSTVNYDYRENSRSSEHGSSRIKTPAHVFNNLTLSTSIERSWKKWLFRAGPFISPQLRPVGYKPDDLSWGGNLQVIYRLGQ